MLFPNIYEQQLPVRWAGRKLINADIGDWLYTNYGFRVIGHMVQGPAWPKHESPPPPETSDENNSRKHPRDENGEEVMFAEDLCTKKR